MRFAGGSSLWQVVTIILVPVSRGPPMTTGFCHTRGNLWQRNHFRGQI